MIFGVKEPVNVHLHEATIFEDYQDHVHPVISTGYQCVTHDITNDSLNAGVEIRVINLGAINE